MLLPILQGGEKEIFLTYDGEVLFLMELLYALFSLM